MPAPYIEEVLVWWKWR